MRVGFIISGLIVFVVAAAFAGIFLIQEPPDEPTRATAPEKLVAATLPSTMPIARITDPDADAGPRYQAAIDYYIENRRPLSQPDPPSGPAGELTAMVIDAMHAGQMNEGVFVSSVEPTVPPQRTDYDAVKFIPGVVVEHARTLRDQGEPEAAAEALRAAFTYGERLFRHGVWLENRFAALGAMELAASELYTLANSEAGEGLEVNTDAVYSAAERVQEIRDRWQPKLAVVSSPEPEVGDLLNVIRNDEDRTFRLAGLLNLSTVKFAPGGGGNADAIASIIEQMKDSDDPLMAQAARALDEMTREDVRNLG